MWLWTALCVAVTLSAATVGPTRAVGPGALGDSGAWAKEAHDRAHGGLPVEIKASAPTPPLTLANSAVRAVFSSSSGELQSLVNLLGEGGPDDYLAGASPSPPSPSPPPPAPSCVADSAGTHFYIKVGGDPSVSIHAHLQ
jgi:hypothetical protein